ncbi:hypothetical protein TFLX_00413 [Thermoflexales bacterium]|nr:hypothetical protein TFLX_00413 [Thermoflexales bacterium]
MSQHQPDAHDEYNHDHDYDHDHAGSLKGWLQGPIQRRSTLPELPLQQQFPSRCTRCRVWC